MLQSKKVKIKKKNLKVRIRFSIFRFFVIRFCPLSLLSVKVIGVHNNVPMNKCN